VYSPHTGPLAVRQSTRLVFPRALVSGQLTDDFRVELFRSVLAQELQALLGLPDLNVSIEDVRSEEENTNALILRRTATTTLTVAYQIVSSMYPPPGTVKTVLDTTVTSPALVAQLNLAVNATSPQSPPFIQCELVSSRFELATRARPFAQLGMSLLPGPSLAFFDVAWTLNRTWNDSSPVWFSVQTRTPESSANVSQLLVPFFASSAGLRFFNKLLPWRVASTTRATSVRLVACANACLPTCLCTNAVHEVRVEAHGVSGVLSSQKQLISFVRDADTASAITVRSNATCITVDFGNVTTS
jgi:hypothetical protein